MTTQRPQDLIFTLFGEYFLHRRVHIWVGSLITLLEPFGLSDGAVRTSLSRMVRRGWLESRRHGRHSYYDLTARGRRILEEGERRILNPTWSDAWDGLWLLLAYSVPEVRRSVRDRFRERLNWLGFGSLGNGLWLSPHRVEHEIADFAAKAGIERYLVVFRARRLDGADSGDLVDRCWDMPNINAQYRAFIDRWQPLLTRCGSGLADAGITPEECYSIRFRLMHEYRGFALIDPYLPRPLLPENWKGRRCSRRCTTSWKDTPISTSTRCWLQHRRRPHRWRMPGESMT